MPNWVTNKICTSPEVIKAMVNAEGHVDFSLAAPFPGEFPWDTISLRAEEMAEIVAGVPLHQNPLIASLEASNRSRAKLSDLHDEDFEQFIQMLRNHRKCGFLNQMDFARATWGTKWNACDSSVSEDQSEASFDTAWSCPKPVFQAVSQRFPDAEIRVTYADEDLGSNCGTYTLRAGAVVQSDIAPPWRDMTEQEQQRWTRFAREVKGWTADEKDE
ncbi:hypothetical protein [Achromobacter sp.]|uniref:DUF1281 family ferredoxin-like fold protein n=1 Tax=Achromobacter sp. TaxID=134375 RepID=UPI0028AE8D44|nr:hypothetical protein [Achromobacter sp.]